jgi:hypothetical protein
MAINLTSNLTWFTTIYQTVSFRLHNADSYDINAASKHEPISYGATLAYQQVASMIPETIPVILESIVSAECIDDEIEAAHEALAIGGPRPRVRRRRSGATAKAVRA